MASFQELARKFVKSQKGNRMVRGHVLASFIKNAQIKARSEKMGWMIRQFKQERKSNLLNYLVQTLLSKS